MRHSLVLAVIGVGLLSLTGCQPVASPLYGWMYNETQFGDFATTSADTTKVGKACAHTIWRHGLPATLVLMPLKLMVRLQ